MADNLRVPEGADSTSTRSDLGKGPQDMPDRGGPKPNAQVTSTQCELSRKESPVAQFGAHPGMGQVQSNSTQAPLSRSANSPYDSVNKTKPEVPFGGRKK